MNRKGIKISEELHKKIKVKAASLNLYLEQLVEKLLETGLRQLDGDGPTRKQDEERGTAYETEEPDREKDRRQKDPQPAIPGDAGKK